MDLQDLRAIKVGFNDSECYRITKEDGSDLWWSLVNIKYYKAAGVTTYLGEENVCYGQNGNKPQVEKQEGDWYFDQWSSPCENVTEDLTAIATYKQFYTVTFKSSIDGSELSVIKVEPKKSVDYPTYNEVQYYTFIGWNPEYINEITCNTTVFANYKLNEIVIDSIQNSYTYDKSWHPFVITAHLNNNPSVSPNIEYSTDNVNWGSYPITEREENTSKKIFYRLSYDNYPSLTGAGMLTITEGVRFTVQFNYKDSNGNDISSSQQVLSGESAVVPQIPSSQKFIFKGWDVDYSKITYDTIVNAIYETKIVSCKVYSSLSVSNTLLTCEYGSALNPIPVCDEEQKDRYVFSKWYTYKNDIKTGVNENELTSFTQDNLEIYPYYNRLYKVNTYVVSSDIPRLYKSYDVISGSNINISDDIPQISGYGFTGFSPSSYNPIESDTNISITYGAEECFYIEALEDTNIKLLKTGSPQEISLIYSLDNKNWLDWDYSTGTTLKTGEKLYLKSKIDSGYFSTDYYKYYTFNFTSKVNVYGNIMCLLYNNYHDKKEITQYCSYRLFYNCSSLVDASNLKLPATKLSDKCYSYMFHGCTGLTSAPELPATTLASYCYDSMFWGCTGLTSAPELSATTLASYCYSHMFHGCTGLTSAPQLPTTILAGFCYFAMFEGCTGLTSAPELSATTLALYCYYRLFLGCLNIPEIHYPVSIENNSTFKSMEGTPLFGAFNATVYYDL